MGNNFTNHHNPNFIPKNAVLVFDGIRAKVYQWDQVLYDGRMARFEKIRFADGAFVLPILKNGNILLTKQEQPARAPFISLPGGGIDVDDSSPLEAAKRELKEETGYISNNWCEWMEFYGTVHTTTNVYYFIARDCEKVSQIQGDGGEKIQLFEVSFDEFLELSSNEQFHHHWNLLPLLYEARLSKQKYGTLKQLFYGK